MSQEFPQVYDGRGRFFGVHLSDAAFIPREAANREWRDFLVCNGQEVPPLSLKDIGITLAQAPAAAVAGFQATADVAIVATFSLTANLLLLLNLYLEARMDGLVNRAAYRKPRMIGGTSSPLGSRRRRLLFKKQPRSRRSRP